MARPLRLHWAGGFFHIVQRGNARQAIFTADRDPPSPGQPGYGGQVGRPFSNGWGGSPDTSTAGSTPTA